MKIRLDLIKPSPHPLRTSWDEQKMQELAQSIEEQGLIVPIKVRPVDDFPWCDRHGFLGEVECPVCEAQALWIWGPYRHDDDGYSIGGWDSQYNTDDGKPLPPEQVPFEIVYGHRRLEAARRAGLTEIEAIVEGVDDTNALIQALIENVQREDMEPMDLARALRNLMQQTGWSQRELERRGIMEQSRVSVLVALLEVPKEVQALVTKAPSGDVVNGKVTEAHVREARRVSKGDDAVITDSIMKAANEGLTATQTRQVAESVAAAESDARREFLLKARYNPAIHDPQEIKRRQTEYGDHDRLLHRPVPSAAQDWERLPEVKEIINTTKVWNRDLNEFMEVATIGKMAPEAQQFLAHRLRPFADKLMAWIEEMEQAING